VRDGGVRQTGGRVLGRRYANTSESGLALSLNDFTGQHVKYDSEKKPMSDLYLTILQQLGCPVKSFKESASPLSEVLA